MYHIFYKTEENLLEITNLHSHPNKNTWIEVEGKRHYVLDITHKQEKTIIVVGEKPTKNNGTTTNAQNKSGNS